MLVHVRWGVYQHGPFGYTSLATSEKRESVEQKTTIVVITGRRRPHMVSLLAFSLLAGILIFSGLAIRPPSVQTTFGNPMVYVWAAGLSLSGAIGLVGCYWQGDVRRGLLLEKSAMFFNAAAVLTYAGAAYSQNGPRAFFAAGFSLFWAASNVARAIQISNDLRSLEGESGDDT